jgi:hypothetical protein
MDNLVGAHVMEVVADDPIIAVDSESKLPLQPADRIGSPFEY